MLRLRPFRKNDAKEIITWTSNEEEFYKWSAGILGEFPVKEERMLQAVKARDYNDQYFPFTAFDESGLVGFFTVRTPTQDNTKVRLGYVIINPAKRGKGYGKQMLLLGLQFLFDLYGAKEVSLGVFDSNPQAYYCYKAIGFKETGIQEEYTLCNQKWIDLDMVIKKEDIASW